MQPDSKLGRKPEIVICTYRIKKGHEARFLKVLSRHWPTLKRKRLVAGRPSLVYRGADESKKTFFIEIFTWKTGKAAGTAHETPDVMQVWEAMGVHMEERLGRPAMDFPHVEPVKMTFAKT